MPYTPPPGNDVEIVFNDPGDIYTPPEGNDTNFDFGPLTTNTGNFFLILG